MAWTKITFGKHNGKTLPQVAFSDPDYIYWAVEQDHFGTRALSTELADIAKKGSRIKIPGTSHVAKKVRYSIDRNVGKVAGVEVIDASQGPHVGSSGTWDSDFFDLSAPRRWAPYDKTGGRFVVDSIKYHVLANTKRLAKEKCEAFFEDASNFG